jgi:hypothetical protein
LSSDLEASLRQAGEKVTQGRIRVDSTRALSRLRDFRFAEPAHWVLEIVRAASLSGSKKVAVRTDADDVEISFDATFPPDLMKHLLEQALNAGASHDERRTRLLALGVAGALGMKAAFVTVESGGVQLTLRDESVDVRETKTRGTFIHLHKLFGWRVVTGLFRGSPEAVALEQRVCRFPGTLLLNGKDLVRSATAPTKTVQGDGFRLEATLPSGAPRQTSTLELDVGGVLVASRTVTLPGLQLEAWVRADGMRRNASGSDVVEGDQLLDSTLVALRRVSVELLTEKGPKLAEDEAWRAAFTRRLIEGDLKDPRARAQLEALPLIPGPAGEAWSVADFKEAARDEKRVYVAKKEYPEGSYPTPAALVTFGSTVDALLPEGKRIDVEPFVKKRGLVAINRKRHEAQPEEEALLPARDWLAKASIRATNVEGEVGFERGGHGAFVRVLHHRKLLASGELTTLSPLRLRAVIDWSRPLGDEFFEGGDDSKLFGKVQKYVEDAAIEALCRALPDPKVHEHALSLLHRLVVVEQRARNELPAAIVEAPLFTCFEADPVSLDRLMKEPHWRFVNAVPSVGLLDGTRLLVLGALERELLQKLGGKKLDNVTNQLIEEAAVRARLAGPRREPVLENVQVKVPLVSDTWRGELGVPKDPGFRLSVTLLKAGIPLETTELTARYHHAVAIVESERFSPNARWTVVTRDDGFKALSNALGEAQRQLISPLLAVPRDGWSPGAHVFLAAAVQRELAGFELGKLDSIQRELALAPLFQTGHQRQTLLELQAQLMQSGRLFVLPDLPRRRHVPKDFHVLFESSAVARSIGAALGTTLEDGTKALEIATLREGLLGQAKVPFELSPETRFETSLKEEHVRVLAGLAPGTNTLARVTITVEGRHYARVTINASLPLELAVEWPQLEPTPARAVTEEQFAELKRLAEASIPGVLAEAAKEEDDADARRAFLLALGATLETRLSPALGSALLERPLFPCTDAQTRSVRDLGTEGVQYAQRELEGLLPNRRPIVVAADPLIQYALKRWPWAEQVDDALVQQRRALADRAKVERREEIRVSVASPWRQPISEQDATGEIALALEGAGRLELYFEHKPLCVLEDVLPAPLTAAIDSPHLTPTANFKGVTRDAQLEAVIALVKAAGDRLAARLATEKPVPPWTGAFARLAFLAAEQSAWEWKGQKKSKKGKKKEQAAEHPLLAAPIFRFSDDAPCTLSQLIGKQRAHHAVEFVTEGGRFLESGRVAWWPRAGEEAAARTLGFTLRDVTDTLRRDESIRRRPRFQGTISSPLGGAWREPVTGAGLEGELVIPALPERQLVIEVLHDRLLLERWEAKHPVGGVARVDSSALTPTDDWRGAKRDAAFKALVQATEAALERVVTRRLERDDADAKRWALVALPWRLGTGGGLASVLANLPLLTDVRGEPVTVGATLELARKRGRAPIAQPVSTPPDTLVLRNDEWNVQVLRALELEFEDVTADLRRAKDLERALTARRLEKLAVGPALLKRTVQTAQLTGELALSLSPAGGEVTLARDGIAVCPMKESWPGVIGVLDVKDLTVSADWTSATLTHAQRDLIAAEVAQLFGALAEAVPSLSTQERALASRWALEYLNDEGVQSAAQLDRLRDVQAALADAPFFVTLEGERVTLREVASEVLSRGKVAVLPSNSSVKSGEVLAIAGPAAGLEGVLGKAKVWRITDPEEWEREVREADPREGTPELIALRFLRKELRLLRAGALGSLTPDELEDLKLERAGGRVPLRYDVKRKLVLLDPAHPDVARALSEPVARPERLWVLLTAIFGLINRELHHVTDAHEVKLLMALAGHLATNEEV